MDIKLKFDTCCHIGKKEKERKGERSGGREENTGTELCVIYYLHTELPPRTGQKYGVIGALGRTNSLAETMYVTLGNK